MRWVTAVAGLACIAAAMLYPYRRRQFRKRAGALRYWMLFHIYAGILGTAMILLHGGTRSGGWLTTMLAIAFDLVILTGLWGMFCYRFVPGWLETMEPGSPLMADDLQRRNEELQRDIANGLTAAAPDTKHLMESAIAELSSVGFLLRQFAKRETLDELCANVRRRYQGPKSRLQSDECDRMDSVTDALASLRRLDALGLLHWLLKSWLVPHVVLTSIMLALLVIHILQALYGVR